MASIKDFKKLISNNPKEALTRIFTCKVEEWLEDGPEEVVRVLTLWAMRGVTDEAPPRIDFGDCEGILDFVVECTNLVLDPDSGD